MSLDVVSARVAFRDRGLLDVLDLALRFLAVQIRSYAKVSVVVLTLKGGSEISFERSPCTASVPARWRA